MPCWEMIVSGKVQGVGYRWYIQDCARKYGIKGYVKNQPDGTVYIIAMGSNDALALFAEDVKSGNRHAQVKQLTINEITHYTDYEDFVIV